MRIGNTSVESVCLSVQALTFEPLKLRTSFRVSRYILTIFRSNLSTKVIGLRSIILNTRSCEGEIKKKPCFYDLCVTQMVRIGYKGVLVTK